MRRLGVLCGTGMSDLQAAFPSDSDLLVTSTESVRVESPWGIVPLDLVTIKEGDTEAKLGFVQRHHSPDGKTTPPHVIEHRANVHAILSMAPEAIVSINAVGSMHPDLPPGSIGLATQVLDLTGRVWTFNDLDAIHADMTSHFDRALSDVCRAAIISCGQTKVADAVVAQMVGPQFESSADIVALKSLGADAVGMTMAGEVRLLAEAKHHPDRVPVCKSESPAVRHVGLSISSNWAAGEVDADIDHDSAEATAANQHGRIWSALLAILDDLNHPEG